MLTTTTTTATTATTTALSSPPPSATTAAISNAISGPYVSRPAGPQDRQRILERRAKAGSALADPQPPIPLIACDLCGVSFTVAKKTHHLQSKRHRVNVQTQCAGRPGKKPKATRPSVSAVPAIGAWSNANECLFCLAPSADIESNIAHMKYAHSFLIPDIEYLVAPVELLVYLAAIIEQGDCLWCHSPEARAAKQSTSVPANTDTKELNDADDTPAFKSALDARKHMAAKGHCKVSWENGAQIAIDGIYQWGEAGDNAADMESGSVSCDANEPKLVNGDLVLASGTRLRKRPSIPHSTTSPSSSSALIHRQSPSLTVTHHGKPLPGRLAETILPLKKSERTAILRCSRAELESLAHLSPSELSQVAGSMDVATRMDATAKTTRYVRGGVRHNKLRKVGGPSTKPKGAMGFGLYYLNT